jgi:hypothetical protein
VRDVTGSEATRVTPFHMNGGFIMTKTRTLQHPGRDAILSIVFHGIMASLALYIAFKQIF